MQNSTYITLKYKLNWIYLIKCLLELWDFELIIFDLDFLFIKTFFVIIVFVEQIFLALLFSELDLDICLDRGVKILLL